MSLASMLGLGVGSTPLQDPNVWNNALNQYTNAVGSPGPGGAEAQIGNTAANYTGQAGGATASGVAPAQQVFNTGAPALQYLNQALTPGNSAGWASTLQSLPGWQASVDAATQAGQRAGAASGTLQSGGTQAALARTLNTQAGQAWNSYIGQLQNNQNAANTAAQTVNQGYGNLASIFGNTGNNLLTQQSNLGQGLGAAGWASAIGPAQATAQNDYYNNNINAGVTGGLFGGLIGLGSKLA